MSAKLPPVHPGRSSSRSSPGGSGFPCTASKEIGVAESTLSRLVRGRSSISAAMALRLARRFSIPPQFWMGLQADYDLDVARDTHGAEIEREVVAG